MPDFTRFDFHVVRFLYSETVKRMTAEEVGQYILLLCEAWILGKEATLPDDPKYLARVARVEKVSPLVLSRFKKIKMDCGSRLQNEPLHKEWLATIKRSESAKERGKRGNESRYGARYSEATANANASQQTSPNPYHTSPTRSIPNQSVPKEEIVKAFAADSEKTTRENEEFLAAKKLEAERAEASRGQF